MTNEERWKTPVDLSNTIPQWEKQTTKGSQLFTCRRAGTVTVFDVGNIGNTFFSRSSVVTGISKAINTGTRQMAAFQLKSH